MQCLTVVKKSKPQFLYLYPNCSGCGKPLPLHMQPIGWCSACLRSDSFLVRDPLDMNYIAFTLFRLEAWGVSQISKLLEVDVDLVSQMLDGPRNKNNWLALRRSL